MPRANDRCGTLAGLGVAGIALGFAPRESVATMIVGFLLCWDRSFRHGDDIATRDRRGRVREFIKRTTRIRTMEHTDVIILDTQRNGVQSQPPAEVAVWSLGGPHDALQARAWIADAAPERATQSDLREACAQAVAKPGIEIPFAHLHLFVARMSASARPGFVILSRFTG